MILEVIRRKDISLNVSRFKKFIINEFRKKGYDVSETSFKTNIKMTKDGEIFEYSFSLECVKEITMKRGREWKYTVKVDCTIKGVPKVAWKRERLLGEVELKIVGGFEHKKEDLTVHYNPFILILQRIFGEKPENIYLKTEENLKKEIKEIKKKIEYFLG